ncbi:MAG: hypothetical protein H7Z12_10980 [Rhodospirillaceae bacterium]|nr:hypothetical protein [Rhodospirillales bacterium]
MDIATVEFGLFCMAGIILFRFRSVIIRRFALLILNAAFLWASAGGSALALMPTLAFLLLGWVLIGPGPDRKPSVALRVGLILAAFAYVRGYTVLDDLPKLPYIYSTLGLSYLLFRILHLVVDRCGGALPRSPGLVDYFGYVLFFPTFVTGPIQRYDVHRAGLEASPPGDRETLEAAARILRGLIKMGVLAVMARWLFDHGANAFQQTGLPGARLVLTHGAASALFCAYMYLNFSGGIDVIMGASRLMGFVLPENFNRPWRAANILDLWSRWHMSLSDWFRTYLFNPVLKTLAGLGASPKAMPYLSVGAFFVTFLLMGVWHGTSAMMVVYGLALGGGVSANKLYQVLMTRRLGKQRYGRLAKGTVYSTICGGAALAWFTLSLTLLWASPQQLDIFLSMGGVLCLGLEMVLLTTAFAALQLVDRLLAALPHRHTAKGIEWRSAMVGLQAFAVLILLFFVNAPAASVYKGY